MYIYLSFFLSPCHLYPFPPCTICFYFLARINIARSRTFTIPSLSVLFTFIFHFLDSCFLSFSFFLQSDGIHFPSSTFPYSTSPFSSLIALPLCFSPLLLLLFHFHNSCRWKLRGRCNIKYAVYPCLESSILYIYVYTFIQFLFSVQSSHFFFYLFYILFYFFPFFLFLFCFLFFYSITINGN